MNYKPWRKIDLQVGDMVVKYENGRAEQGVLQAKQSPYYDHRKEQRVGALWKVLGWESRILESFLKRKIFEQIIDHYPARRK